MYKEEEEKKESTFIDKLTYTVIYSFIHSFIASM